MIRNEYKVWIYKNYFVPSIRFLLTVHKITHTDLQTLDRLVHKYSKHWVGLPNCSTNLVFHMKGAMDIPSITTLYQEVQCLNYTAMRIKGDSTLNTALDSAVERESQLVRKKSIVVYAHKTHVTSMHMNCVGGELPSFPDDR